MLRSRRNLNLSELVLRLYSRRIKASSSAQIELWEKCLCFQKVAEKKSYSSSFSFSISSPLPPELNRALWVKTVQVAMARPREAEPAVWVPDYVLTLIKGRRERGRTIWTVIISRTVVPDQQSSDHVTSLPASEGTRTTHGSWTPTRSCLTSAVTETPWRTVWGRIFVCLMHQRFILRGT